MYEGIFAYGYPNETAFLNWTMNRWDTSENFYKMAEGYRYAAETVVNSLLADNSNHIADKVIFPLLFLCEQAVELYLKSILQILCRLCGKNYNNEVRKKSIKHDLGKLVDCLLETEKALPQNSSCEQDLKPLTDYINERIKVMEKLITIANQDKSKSEIKQLIDKQRDSLFLTMRYPADNKLSGSFYVETYENVPVDLRYLAKRFDEIYDRLEFLQYKYASIEEKKKRGELTPNVNSDLH